MSFKMTKDFDLNLDNITFGKALVFKQEDNTYTASCLWWKIAKGRLLKTDKNKGTTNPLLYESKKFDSETENETIEKIEKWAKEEYGEKVIMKEKNNT